MTTMFDQRDAVAFQPVSVLGVFWPFGGPQAAGPTIGKPSGADGWDSYAVSTFGYHYTDSGVGPQAKSSVFFQPVSGDKAMVVGLYASTDQPTQSPTVPYGFPQFAFFLRNVGTYCFIINDVVTGTDVAYTANSIFLVAYDGPAGEVRFYVDEVLVHTEAATDGLKTWAMACFFRAGAQLRNFQFGPLPEMRFPASMEVGAGTVHISTFTDLPGLYIDEPYDYPGDWDERMAEWVYADLRSAGYQAFRLQVNPGPWLEAKLIADATARAARLEFLNGKIDQAVYGSIARGFGIILTAFYTGFAGLTSETALQGLGTDGWNNHRWLYQMWAERYVAQDPAMFMMETFNEPPAPDRYPADWNNDLQPDIYALLRAAMPDHTILLTADGWSGMERMCTLDLAEYDYDGNTIWDFHPFRPSPFAQQGYIYTQYKHVGPINDPLRYPPDPRQRAKVEADYLARATAAGVSEGEMDGVISDLGYYFNIPQDGHWMRTQMFAGVLSWCAAQNIPPARIMVGEWGIVRTNSGFPLTIPPIPGSQGADHASAVTYLADFKSAIDLACFRPAIIHWDTLDYRIALGTDHFVGRLDPDLNAAIAPHRHLIKWSVG